MNEESEVEYSISKEEEGSWYAERRFPNDKDNETIALVSGYPRNNGGWPSSRVWFCRITKDGLTVEDYATEKRAALRITRRAWRKARDKKWSEQYGYPRVIES